MTGRALFLSLTVLLAGCETLAPRTPVYSDLHLSCEGLAATLPGTEVASAAISEEAETVGRWKVAIVLKKNGAAVFADLTKKAVGKQLVIRASGKTILSATMMQPIVDGRITVTGYRLQEASEIVDALTKKPAPAKSPK
jgi:preprotein translocase subunit SecD